VIERGLDGGLTQAQVAVVLGRSPATVSREVRRGGGPPAARPRARSSRSAAARRTGRPTGRPRRYRADRAHRSAVGRARRPTPHKLVGRLAAVVSGLLAADWSPQQIAAMLPQLYPGDQALRVSHETIYTSSCAAS
jgi:IS30 family transposase